MKTVLCLCALCLLVMKSYATIHVVNVVGFTFSPSSITIQQGDTVRWIKTTGLHNVAETSAVPVFRSGNPVSTAFTYDFAFAAPLEGTYSYQCDVHFSLGMVGTVTVEAPAPCLPPEDFAMIPGDNNNEIDFFWNAPQAGRYDIYSTPDAELNTTPPGAGWTQEVAAIVPSAGLAISHVTNQTEDQLFYVVIHNCAP